MKRKCLLIVLLVFSGVYFMSCLYLLALVEPVKRHIDTLLSERGLSPVKIDLVHQFIKPVCQCAKPPETVIFSRTKTVRPQTVSVDRETCSLVAEHKPIADLQVLDLYSTLQLRYDNYKFHHRGWISEFDKVTYFSSQWDEDPLEVFVVPFSHQDPGWKSPMEQIYKDKTRTTLEHMIEFLTSDPKLTFVWSEVIFLEKWYNLADTSRQKKLKKLLAGGQLEVLTGGWVMTDEAVSHYYSMLDQLIEGHQWLYNTLNYTVSAAWSLDAFGVSPTMTYLLRNSGVSSLLIQRIHYNLKRALAAGKQLEFVWRQAWDRSNSTDLFTHVPPFLLYNILYNCGPDPEICCHFDFTKKHCYEKGRYIKPEPITEDNVKEKAWLLLDQLRKKSQFFKHHKLLVLYGDDFRFQDVSQWQSLYKNLKPLMDYMNSESKMHIKIRFSTLSEYFRSVKSTLTTQKLPVPSLVGDFFTYNDRADQYWSGYFTSRPMFKHLVRTLQQKLRSAEILFSLLTAHTNTIGYRKSVHLTSTLWRRLIESRRALGLFHHHDAITGTSQPGTVNDFFNRVYEAVKKVNHVAGACVSFLLQHPVDTKEALKGDLFAKLDFQLDNKAPITSKVLVKTYSVLAVFNPLTSEREQFISVIVTSPFVLVEDIKGRTVSCQLSPEWTDWLRTSKDRYKLTFRATLQPLAVSRFYIKHVERRTGGRCDLVRVKAVTSVHSHDVSSVFTFDWVGLDDFVLSTPLISAYFCGCTGLLQGVLNRDRQIYHEVKLNFVHYGTGSWTNPLYDKSGAYIFLPNGLAQGVDITNPKIMIIEGPLLAEIKTVLPMVNHTVTLYNTTGINGAGVHIENVANLQTQTNIELAMQVSTDINNDGVFYTDNNGFQMQRRKYLPKYKIQGNYYPITTQMYIEDSLFRATLHTTYSHGASSLSPGTMEVMLDRRLHQDDWRGLGEGIEDNVLTPSHFVLLIETRQKAVSLQKTGQLSHPSALSHQISLGLNHPAELFIQLRAASLPTSPYQPLSHTWPCDFHLVNWRSLTTAGHSTDDQTWQGLLLVHRMAYNCDYLNTYQNCTMSHGELPLSEMFSHLKINKISQTSLTGLSIPLGKPEHLLNTSIKMDVMDLKAYRLHLEET